MNPSPRVIRALAAGVAAIAVASFAIACSKSTTIPDPPPPPPVTPTLVSVGVTPTSVVGGNAVQGTVTLSAGPTSAASVTLQSNTAAATVPGTVTVNAGATTASFSVATTVVGSSTPVSISATFGGTTQSTTLTVNPVPPPALAANFVVISQSPARRKTKDDDDPVTILPAGTVDACPLVNSSNPELDCIFNGATSTGGVVAWIWTYSFGTKQEVFTSMSPQHEPRPSGCGFFGGQNDAAKQDGAVQFLQMSVQLQVRDAANNLSPVRTNQNVRIFPSGFCGYGF